MKDGTLLRKRYFWTTREVRLVAEHYPVGGVGACLPLLPGRSARAIHQQAAKQGVRAPLQPARRQHWTSNEHIDAAIRRTYAEAPARNAINELADRVMRPRWWVSKRALALGVVPPRLRQPGWTDVEVELLHAHAHKNPDVIARIFRSHGFARTATSIEVKRKRLHCQAADPEHETARGLATLMGVDPTTVTRWIEKGLLRAKRRGTDRVAVQGGDMWWICRKDVRRFIVANAQEVDLRKVDKFWFIDLLGGGA